MSNYEVYQDEAGQWRWRLRADNGEIVASSESYTRESDAFRGAESAKRAADKAPLGNGQPPE